LEQTMNTYSIPNESVWVISNELKQTLNTIPNESVSVISISYK
jgi:hypothetical protein